MFQLNSLKINHIEKPFIISTKPSFSWTYALDKNVKQKTYQVLVSSKNYDDGDYWNSGIIKSNEMNNVIYCGRDFPSRSNILVKVITTSENGEVSEITSSFETAIKDNEWLGRWVSIPNNFNGGTLLFRKTLELKKKPIKKARAYIIGLGYHEFYVNAKKIGDAYLNPGVTDYNLSVLYDIYDFTCELDATKDNVIGIEVGYGWLGSRKLLAQFYIEYEDGEIFEDHSDVNHGWWVSGSPTINNSIYGGEEYDARLEDLTSPHWASREFEPTWENGWMYTIRTQPVVGKKVYQEMPSIRHTATFKAISRYEFNKNDYVFDIGQNIAGWANIKVKGNRGTRITLKYGERLQDDGHVNQLNLRSAKCVDVYILKGKTVESWHPRFTYHGFQYVEVLIDGEAEIIELEGQFIHTDNKEISYFKCDDEIINKLHHMAKITEQNNQTSIFTDCPQRDERFGWLNDVSSRIFQQTYNFDCDRMYNKVVRDIRETANDKGAIADTAPYYTGGQPADTTTVSYLLFPLFAYKFYGDIQLVENEYEGNKKWVDYLLTHQKDYVMDYAYYADWVNPDKLEDSFSDPIFVSSMFLTWHLKVIIELSRILNKKKEIKYYSKHLEASIKSLNEKYYHKEGYYSKNTQCENAMAIWLGICEENNKQIVMDHIVENIKKNNMHLTCGNQGYRHVFYLLCEYGYQDIALNVLRNKEYPGWGYMVENGATTVWERWESVMFNIMDSFDHPMFGSYDAIFFKYLGGINVEGCGGDKITIHPTVPDSLSFVETKFNSVRGEISSSWKKEDKKVVHNIVIPSNNTFKLIFDRKVISLDGKEFNEQNFELSSGEHQIITE